MAKKPKILIPNPEIGKESSFIFAGFETQGVLERTDEKLSLYYQEPWYMMRVLAENDPGERETLCPISIRALISEIIGSDPAG